MKNSCERKKRNHSFKSKRSSLLRFMVTGWLLFITTLSVWSQSSRTVTGVVTDPGNEPVIGASVVVEGTTTGTVTDMDGNFTLQIPDGNQKIRISYLGYVTQTVEAGNKTSFIIRLQDDSQTLDDVVVIGYGTQKKGSIIGSVAAISSDDLIVTKSMNVENMLTGKVPGVRVVQKTSEPGEFNNQFDIRGFGNPLIVVDGVPRGNLARMDPNEIESISVLKDASAAVYGVRAANGVVLVTTKKGERGKTKVEYNMYYGIQTPAEMLKPVGAVERMILANEKSMRNTTNPLLTYSEEQIEEYRNGTLTSTDWYDATLRNTAPQQQHNISLSGGGDKVDYYINLGYNYQGGFFRSGDLNYDRYNLRSNINVEITKNLKASLKINSILDEKNRPQASTWSVYGTLWRSVPNQTVYANDREGYYTKPLSDIQNVVAMTRSDVSGYYKEKRRIFQSTMDLTYDVPFIPGLSLKGMFSYDTNVDDTSNYTLAYNEYDYDEATEEYTARARNSPTTLERNYVTGYSTLWHVSANYTKKLFDKHSVNLLLLYEEGHSEGDNLFASRQYTIPLPYLFAGNTENQVGTARPNRITEYASKGLVGRANYDFAGKYLAEFSFRYDGSSKFPKDKQWGFFPSALIGWRMSEEAFIKNNFTFVDNLKLKASYGKMGDDSAAEYQFITGYDYPNTSGAKNDNYPTGYVFNGEYINGLGFRTIANPNITWYTVRTINLGLEVELWNGKLGFDFDVFQRNRDGLLADRLVSVPGTFGAKMPQENLNSDRTKGFEVEVRHRNQIGDLFYNVAGNVSITRNMYRYRETATFGNSYDYWRNGRAYRYSDIWFGWGSAGRYGSYDEIAYSNILTNNAALPGDYIYEDWNGDGVIDDLDRYPIATTTDAEKADFQDKRNYPLMNFGLSISLDYKGFDLSMMFQGAAMSYISYGEQLALPLLWNGNALDLFLDRWHTADPTKDPYDRSNEWISGYYGAGGTNSDNNSGFAVQNGAYMRLKTLELGYTIPRGLLTKVGVKQLRVYTSMYNLFTITGVKGVDPEKPSELYGLMYPLNRTFNFGATLTF